jgi:hypothetical protein
VPRYKNLSYNQQIAGDPVRKSLRDKISRGPSLGVRQTQVCEFYFQKLYQFFFLTINNREKHLFMLLSGNGERKNFEICQRILLVLVCSVFKRNY